METIETFPEATTEKNGVLCHLSHIGEGYNGDFDEEDSQDKMLLRFDFSTKTPEGEEEVEDASYCTNLTLPATQEAVQEAANLLLEMAGPEILENGRAKRTCEALSWANWDWIAHCRGSKTLCLPEEFFRLQSQAA